MFWVVKRALIRGRGRVNGIHPIHSVSLENSDLKQWPNIRLSITLCSDGKWIKWCRQTQLPLIGPPQPPPDSTIWEIKTLWKKSERKEVSEEIDEEIPLETVSHGLSKMEVYHSLPDSQHLICLPHSPSSTPNLCRNAPTRDQTFTHLCSFPQRNVI